MEQRKDHAWRLRYHAADAMTYDGKSLVPAATLTEAAAYIEELEGRLGLKKPPMIDVEHLA